MKLREFAEQFREGWAEAPSFRDVWDAFAAFWRRTFL